MTRAFLAGAAGVLLLAGCSREDHAARKAAAITADAARAPQVITYSASDFAYSGPDTIPAGLTTIRMVNTGQEPHHIWMVRLADGKTMDDFVGAMQHEGPMPEWAELVGGPNAAESGDTISATVAVQPGNHVLFCVIPSADTRPHIAKGMIRPLTVVPATAPAAAAPTSDVTMTFVDYGFNLSAPITPGVHTIRFENNAAQPHEVVIVRLDSAATIQDWMGAIEKMQGPLPGDMVNGISGIKPGGVAYITQEFTPGRYGLVCFVPDAKDGKPHFVHGMITEITVSQT